MADRPAYKLSILARDDLERIWRYTRKNWSDRQANSYLADIMAMCSKLTETPQLGRSIDVRKAYLKCPVGAHFIFFRRVDSNLIEIIRVLHQQMDVKRHL